MLAYFYIEMDQLKAKLTDANQKIKDKYDGNGYDVESKVNAHKKTKEKLAEAEKELGVLRRKVAAFESEERKHAHSIDLIYARADVNEHAASMKQHMKDSSTKLQSDLRSKTNSKKVANIIRARNAGMGAGRANFQRDMMETNTNPPPPPNYYSTPCASPAPTYHSYHSQPPPAYYPHHGHHHPQPRQQPNYHSHEYQQRQQHPPTEPPRQQYYSHPEQLQPHQHQPSFNQPGNHQPQPQAQYQPVEDQHQPCPSNQQRQNNAGGQVNASNLHECYLKRPATSELMNPSNVPRRQQQYHPRDQMTTPTPTTYDEMPPPIHEVIMNGPSNVPHHQQQNQHPSEHSNNLQRSQSSSCHSEQDSSNHRRLTQNLRDLQQSCRHDLNAGGISIAEELEFEEAFYGSAN